MSKVGGKVGRIIVKWHNTGWTAGMIQWFRGRAVCTCTHFHPMSRSSACLTRVIRYGPSHRRITGLRTLKSTGIKHTCLPWHIADKIDRCGGVSTSSPLCTDENHVCGWLGPISSVPSKHWDMACLRLPRLRCHC